MISAQEYALNAQGDFGKEKIAKVYQEYEKQMHANNALDFDDLLVKTVQLVRDSAGCVGELPGAVSLYYGG